MRAAGQLRCTSLLPCRASWDLVPLDLAPH
jgi:hypothetical protein